MNMIQQSTNVLNDGIFYQELIAKKLSLLKREGNKRSPRQVSGSHLFFKKKELTTDEMLVWGWALIQDDNLGGAFSWYYIGRLRMPILRNRAKPGKGLGKIE